MDQLQTLFLVFWVLVITVGLGTLLAVLFDQDFYGRGIARLLAIAPFFVMPTVSAASIFGKRLPLPWR